MEGEVKRLETIALSHNRRIIRETYSGGASSATISDAHSTHASFRSSEAVKRSMLELVSSPPSSEAPLLTLPLPTQMDSTRRSVTRVNSTSSSSSSSSSISTLSKPRLHHGSSGGHTRGRGGDDGVGEGRRVEGGGFDISMKMNDGGRDDIDLRRRRSVQQEGCCIVM